MSKEPQSIEEIIDSQGELPHVELMVNPKKRIPKGTLVPMPMTICSDDKIIGEATLVVDKKREEEYFNGISLNQQFRGRGFGTATYIQAINHAHSEGRTFRSHDWSQTEAAAKIWSKFVDLGIAEVIEPLEYGKTEDDGTKKFTSHLQIPPRPVT